MHKMSMIRALIEFNKRVLYQGIPEPGKQYSMQALKELLFFNSVFMSNTHEMFERYNCLPIMDDYVELLDEYISSVARIMAQMNARDNSIVFLREDSFERRFTMFQRLQECMTVSYSDYERGLQYRFNSGQLYYIGLNSSGNFVICWVDPNLSVYKSPMSFNIGRQTLYWKTDDCIRDYLKSRKDIMNVVAIRVTTSDDDYRDIKKVEYNGDDEFMKKISWAFGRKALIISNPFIYTDDIDQILKSKISDDVITRQEFHPVDLNELLKHDRLVEYPKDSFNEYLDLLRTAAEDPEVTEIHLTLYRIGKDPTLFYILARAVANGVKVHVNIELCASGEKINKMWMHELQEAGVEVSTYLVGFVKIHCKLTLIKFQSGKTIAQIGTGNYHTKTTSQYTDLSLVTANESICNAVEKLFDVFAGKRDDVSFNTNLLVTRYNARDELLRMIREQGDLGPEGYIAIKCNSLDDDEIIEALDEAAKNGCEMDLIIRSVCTWVPTVLGRNVNIRSIVWDKLEHSRVYAFGEINPVIYMGSLDLTKKKIDDRIETLVLVKDPNIEIKICEYLNRYITNSKGSWLMTSSGMYIKE